MRKPIPPSKAYHSLGVIDGATFGEAFLSLAGHGARTRAPVKNLQGCCHIAAMHVRSAQALVAHDLIIEYNLVHSYTTFIHF